jgi:DNA-binding TFAR19-related protein (PDSD5 family)
MSSSSSSSNDNSVRIRDYATAITSDTSSEQAAESIKNVAMGIVEAASSIRELVLTLHQSGAIEEIARAARAIRDTANEINDTVKNLNERGIIKDTTSAVEETTNVARDTIHTVKAATREAAETAPMTIKTLKEVSDKVRSKVTENSSSD